MPLLAALLVFGMAAGTARAQIGKGYDTSLPIEITADTLEVQQEEQLAIFTGNVNAVQGELNLRADRLIVYYRANAAESNAIRMIEAYGNVFLSSPTEMAQGAKGVYNLDTDTVELTGGVQLTRGDSVIRGDRLEMDLATGRSRVSSYAAGTQQKSPSMWRDSKQSVSLGSTPQIRANGPIRSLLGNLRRSLLEMATSPGALPGHVPQLVEYARELGS